MIKSQLMPDIKTIFLKGFMPYFWIILIGFILYAQAVNFGYTYLDDNILILKNFNFINNPGNIGQFFLKDAFLSSYGGSYYRPILTISLMIDSLLLGNSPIIFHLTNILLHLAAACLFFAFLLKLKMKRDTSFLFALIFTVHPVLTQVVCWIPGRNDSLLAVFILLSLIFFLDYLEKRKPRGFLLHLIFFVCALFTKEQAAFLPIMVIAYLVLINKEKIALKDYILFISSWVLMIVPWFYMRYLALHAVVGNADYNIPKSLGNNSISIISYIGKAVLPFNLSVLPILKDLSMVYGSVVLIMVCLALFYSRQKRVNYIVFGIFWFLIFLVPSFIQSASQTANFSEHRMCLPIIGLILIKLEIDYLKHFDLKERSSILFLTAIVIFFSILTFNYSKSFANKTSFWENAVKHSQSSAFNHNNLGAMYYLDKNYGKAEKEWLTASNLNPKEPLVHGNLGLIYMNSGRLKEAEVEYLKEIKINPCYDNIYFNLGLLYAKQGKYAKAKEMWEKTLEINPGHAEAKQNLVVLYKHFFNIKK